MIDVMLDINGHIISRYTVNIYSIEVNIYKHTYVVLKTQIYLFPRHVRFKDEYFTDYTELLCMHIENWKMIVEQTLHKLLVLHDMAMQS